MPANTSVESRPVEIAVQTPSIDEAVALYDEVGWSAYTRDPDTLRRGLDGSLRVVTARHAGKLVGLARVVGDGATIAYLQDILVDPSMHRRGIGSRLFEAAFAPFGDVRQHVLITDADAHQRAFYEAMGLTEVRNLSREARAFVRFA